jgi:hypothetical protein
MKFKQLLRNKNFYFFEYLIAGTISVSELTGRT